MREEALRKYFEEVKEEFGIEKPTELVLSQVEEEGFYAPESGHEEVPAKVVIFSEQSLKEAKKAVRHELAHSKLHWGPITEPSTKDAEDMARQEMEADLLAYGKVKPLHYYMCALVLDYNLSRRQAYQTVKGVAEAFGLPRTSIVRGRRAFYKIPTYEVS